MIEKLKKYWPEIATTAVWLWVQLGPAMTAFIQAHPHVSADVAAVAMFLARAAGSSIGKVAE